MKKSALPTVMTILGFALIVVGLVYATRTANALPHFFPGYDAALTTHHVKHSVASILLGLACLAYVWFKTGPKSGPSDKLGL